MHGDKMIDLTTLSVDQLIQLDNPTTGEKCFTRYTGPINTSANAAAAERISNDYVGVEWLQPGRGKHNGYYNGRQYFTAATHNCSFVRAERVLPRCTLQAVVRDKYVRGEYSNTINDQKYEFRGEQLNKTQFSNLHNLRTINVAGSCIDDTVYAGVCSDLQSATEIDLSNNLITTWNYILQFAPLQHLQVLNLSRNYLHTVDSAAFSGVRFCALHTLILNDMQLSEAVLLHNLLQILELHCMSALQHIVLVRNNLSQLINSSVAADRLIQALSTVQTLDLSYNNLNSSVVSSVLGQLPQLRKLVLSHNNLHTFHYTAGYSQLTQLSLDNNALRCMCCVDQVAMLPALTHLNIKCNRFDTVDKLTYFKLYDAHPLHHTAAQPSADSSELRLELIARLPRLQYLNNSAISDKTRTAAEIQYCKSALQLYNDVYAKQAAGVLKPIEHYYVRYSELCNKYADVLQSIKHDSEHKENVNNTNLSNTVHTLNFIYVPPGSSAGSSGAQTKQLTKSVPNSITINKLKLLLTKLFALKPGSSVHVRYSSSSDLASSQLVDERQLHKKLTDLDMVNNSYVWLVHDK